MSTIINVENLSVAYQENQLVLDDVSFGIALGQAVALLGHNGSGKSTLLKTLIGLIKSKSGKVEILGKIIGKNLSILKNIRSKIGFVFQNHNLVKRISVLSNVIHGELGKSNSPLLWFQCFAPEKFREKALDKLSSVGLKDFAMRKAGKLSGGQSQRVAIARALMQEPEIIFADEPVASLDPHAGEEVMQLMHKLCKEQGITLVFTTHNLKHALEYSDQVIALKDGKIEFIEETKQLNNDKLKDLYE